MNKPTNQSTNTQIGGDASSWTSGHQQGGAQEQLKKLMDQPSLSDKDWARNDKVERWDVHPSPSFSILLIPFPSFNLGSSFRPELQWSQFFNYHMFLVFQLASYPLALNMFHHIFRHAQLQHLVQFLVLLTQQIHFEYCIPEQNCLNLFFLSSKKCVILKLL